MRKHIRPDLTGAPVTSRTIVKQALKSEGASGKAPGGKQKHSKEISNDGSFLRVTPVRAGTPRPLHRPLLRLLHPELPPGRQASLGRDGTQTGGETSQFFCFMLCLKKY